MGEHNGNLLSQIKRNGGSLPPKGQERQWQLLPLGDDYVVADVTIEKAIDKDGNVCMLLAILAGTLTPIGGLKLGKFMLHEMGKIPVANVKGMIDKAFRPEMVDKEAPAAEEKPA